MVWDHKRPVIEKHPVLSELRRRRYTVALPVEGHEAMSAMLTLLNLQIHILATAKPALTMSSGFVK